MMESDDVRGSTRGRGRIAEVLAEARASLKEPSRPFTPASLDARTSIDVKALDRYGNRGPLAKQPSFGRLSDDYYQPPALALATSSRAQSFEDLDVPGRASAKRLPSSKTASAATSTSSSSAPSSLSGPASEVRRVDQPFALAAPCNGPADATFDTLFLSRPLQVLLAVYKLREALSPLGEQPDEVPLHIVCWPLALSLSHPLRDAFSFVCFCIRMATMACGCSTRCPRRCTPVAVATRHSPCCSPLPS